LIGNRAADILKSILQKFDIVNLHDESIDLGIDMRAQVIENNIPKDQFFNIQCKGKDDIDILAKQIAFTICSCDLGDFMSEANLLKIG